MRMKLSSSAAIGANARADDKAKVATAAANPVITDWRVGWLVAAWDV